MRTYEHIAFENKEYKCRRINIKGWGNYLVASTFLQKKLINEECQYNSDEARIIDEGIFFFINPNYYKLHDSKLAKEILKSLQ